jgi:carbonic anhydrase
VEASFVVLLVALPLSLGIAVASGAPVAAGIIAAVVGGVVAGLLGGVPLQVSGPAAGLTAVVAALVAEHGWAVTCFITAAAGLVQIVFGLSRVARVALAISPAVVHGMLAGIGLTIVLGQLNVLLGGASRSSALHSLLAVPGEILTLHTASAVLGIASIVLTLLWPRLPRPLSAVPAPLAAVALVTAGSLPFTVDRVDLPADLLTAVSLPGLPEQAWLSVAVGVLTVALVASVESLLSAVAVERMHEGPRGDLNRELIGQGVANTASGLLGGLPVTGVIVRSSTNVRAGARTRASTVLHGIWVAVFSLLLVGLVRQIPLSVLAGLLVVIGLRLVDLGHLRTVAHHRESVIWAVTLGGVVLFNLLEGVLLGIALAVLFTIRRAVSTQVRVEPPQAQPSPPTNEAGTENTSADTEWRITLSGTLTFIALPRLGRHLARIPHGAPVRLDLHLDYVDHAAFEHLSDWIDSHRRSGAIVTIDELGPPVMSRINDGHRPPISRTLETGPPRGIAPWNRWQRTSTTPASDALTATAATGTSSLLTGVADFHRRLAPMLKDDLADLRDGQRPSSMFITCADSRLVPNVITSSGPGDLFTVRNVGNLLPAPGTPQAAEDSTLAAVEYAVEILEVTTIVICGHSGCGAMNALLRTRSHPTSPGENGATATPVLERWLVAGKPSIRALDDHDEPSGGADNLSQINVIQQLEHLRAHPAVHKALTNGRVTLVGMYFDIDTAQALVLDQDTGKFTPPAPRIPARV